MRRYLFRWSATAQSPSDAPIATTTYTARVNNARGSGMWVRSVTANGLW
jgi:hypothetical protein